MFDDIQDRSSQRNHRPTVWELWGVDQGINVGLSLSCYSRLALHQMLEEGVPPRTVLEVHQLLEETAVDLCRGQYLDLDFRDRIPSLEEYREMVRLKTGVLLGTACQVGALVAGHCQEVQEKARVLGETLGVAFQFRDDYLGVWGEASRLGKVPDDLEERKRGLPLVLGLETARSGSETPCMEGLLVEHPGDAQATADLYTLLVELGVRDRADALIRDAAEAARLALIKLPMPAGQRSAFEGLVGFVVARSN